MHAPPQGLIQFLELRVHPLGYRLPQHDELSASGLPAHVREAQEVEGRASRGDHSRTMGTIPADTDCRFATTTG